MLALRWTVAAILLLVFLLISVGNVFSIIAYLWRKQHISAIPFIGGILGVCGFLAPPVGWLSHWWWLPLVIDYGSLPMMVVFFIWYAMRTIKVAKC